MRCRLVWRQSELIIKNFFQKLQQRYAYHATRAKLAEQGFDLVEETQEGNRIHLTTEADGAHRFSQMTQIKCFKIRVICENLWLKTMELQEIDVFIEPNGQVKIEVSGVKG